MNAERLTMQGEDAEDAEMPKVSAFRCYACGKIEEKDRFACPRCATPNALHKTKIDRQVLARAKAEDAPFKRRILSEEERSSRQALTISPTDPSNDDDTDTDDDEDDEDGVTRTFDSSLVDDGDPMQLEDIEEGKALMAYASGFHALDELTSDSNGFLGSFVYLVGGDPGVGKSRLLTQVAANISRRYRSHVVYGAAEENPQRIRRRLHKMGLLDAFKGKLTIKPGSDIDSLVEFAYKRRAGVLIVDSVQEYGTRLLDDAPPGSLKQTVAVTKTLSRYAQETEKLVLAISQVNKTKAGAAFAGLRQLEHAVDATAMMRTETSNDDPRLLGSVIFEYLKNREGQKGVTRFRWTNGDDPPAGRLLPFVMPSSDSSDEDSEDSGKKAKARVGRKGKKR